MPGEPANANCARKSRVCVRYLLPKRVQAVGDAEMRRLIFLSVLLVTALLVAYAAYEGLANGVQDKLDVDLWWAARGRDYARAASLLRLGARPNRHLKEQVDNIDLRLRDGPTPLILAVRNSDEPMVRLLLRHGARVDSRDQYGSTALLWAVRYDEARIGLALLN